ncbi:coatomer subunit beta'-2-like [Cynara cardunculus var. scolymus]|uniref:coatomer subunit beta'-2-like n=1 Tax=Cynara cardunculus var. scolymus TaxID=59895 RepID=UPI000D62599D|nr:coatomer subunit beta'-2-like [Cynara cardunculus var. scolymus]
MLPRSTLNISSSQITNLHSLSSPSNSIISSTKMSSMVEIKKTFDRRSERVKSVDVHPTEPWVLLGLYSGNVCIWNYHSQVVEKTFEIVKTPVRTSKFIAHKEWIVVGTDDGFIRVYNYNTMERVVEIKAHDDFLRSVVVHPSHPYILSASDDKLIKLWDWEKNWECVQTFQGHDHYVMQIAFNPRDANVFASASLDCTVKTWNLGHLNQRSSIEGHLQGVNSVEFFNTDEKLYLITGSDDNTVKVWDYETETCVQTLEGHSHNVTSTLCVNSDVSSIITGSEDGTVRVWDAKTYNLDHVFTSELGRVWTIGFIKDSAQIVFGCDEGTIIGQVISTRA